MNPLDEIPNEELAQLIVKNNDSIAVEEELVENLNNKSAAVQSDCIKVLYEIDKHPYKTCQKQEF